jgi:HEAT repeat protein
MSGTQLLTNAVLIVFAVDLVLLSSLIVGKGIHRRRQEGRERRRVAYLELLSRQLSDPDQPLNLGPHVAEDQAFLDALIDVRNSVVGPESDALSQVVDRFGVMERYAKILGGRRWGLLTRRLHAAVALAEVADSSWAPALMSHLSDPEPEIRIQAARGLGRMRWTPAIDAIVSRFAEETPWVRARFADTLVNFGSKATWPLLAYIKVNQRFETSGPAAAIRTLATIGDDQAVKSLIELLDEAVDPEIQIATIEALGLLGNPVSIGSLKRANSDPDWRLRAKSATALGATADPTVIPTLSSGLMDPNWWVRRNSAAALARVPRGIPELYAAIRSTDPYARDAAAEALADAGEIIAARRRLEDGDATSDDVSLVSFIESELAVSG